MLFGQPEGPAMAVMVSNEAKPQHTFDSPEMGAIAHLYRGEVYRSTIWRTRLDHTTNWSIVTMGIAAPVIDRSRTVQSIVPLPRSIVAGFKTRWRGAIRVSTIQSRYAKFLRNR